MGHELCPNGCHRACGLARTPDLAAFLHAWAWLNMPCVVALHGAALADSRRWRMHICHAFTHAFRLSDRRSRQAASAPCPRKEPELADRRLCSVHPILLGGAQRSAPGRAVHDAVAALERQLGHADGRVGRRQVLDQLRERAHAASASQAALRERLLAPARAGRVSAARRARGAFRCAGRVRRKGVDMRAGVRGQSPVHNPSMHDPSRPDSSMHNPSMHDAFMRMRAGQARAPAWACTQHGTIANGLRASCARRSANSVACAAPARRPARSWHGERLAHEVCGPRRCTAGAHAASTDAGSMVPHAQVGSSEHRLPRSCLVHVA
jgi:hypothetical protein